MKAIPDAVGIDVTDVASAVEVCVRIVGAYDDSVCIAKLSENEDVVAFRSSSECVAILDNIIPEIEIIVMPVLSNVGITEKPVAFVAITAHR